MYRCTYMMYYIMQVSNIQHSQEVLGEDARSIEQHVQAIASEMGKSRPDLQLLCDKMKRTVAYRQKLCLDSKIADVLKTFPSLKMHVFVSFTVQMSS
jgi:hypothetical protein